jgi:hypothetical protein
MLEPRVHMFVYFAALRVNECVCRLFLGPRRTLYCPGSDRESGCVCDEPATKDLQGDVNKAFKGDWGTKPMARDAFPGCEFKQTADCP